MELKQHPPAMSPHIPELSETLHAEFTFYLPCIPSSSCKSFHLAKTPVATSDYSVRSGQGPGQGIAAKLAKGSVYLCRCCLTRFIQLRSQSRLVALSGAQLCTQLFELSHLLVLEAALYKCMPQ